MAMPFKPVSNKLVIESAIDSFNKSMEAQQEAARQQKAEETRAFKENECIVQRINNRNANRIKFNSFMESVTAALLGESIYYVFSKAIDPVLKEQANVTGIMRAMVGDFIKEDANSILSSMRTKNVTLSEMYNLITSTRSKIKKMVEDAGIDDPSAYRIDTGTRDEFFDQLDKMDTSEIADAIRERVTDSMNEFIEKNKQDHDAIMNCLQVTKDKIDSVPDATEEVKESYQVLSRRKIAKIRNRKKGVFESMVEAMCESCMKNQELSEEFTENGKLNVPKIVDRMQVMYTFIETVNTMNLYKVDEAYMQNLIESLRV